MTTPTYGFRYQLLTDPPDGAGLGEHLANDVEDKIETVDAAIARIDAGDLLAGSIDDLYAAENSYTPSWTSTGTAPSLGNGTRAGAYTKLGRRVEGRIFFEFGSTTNFGSGTYRFGLPVTPASPGGLTNATWVGPALLRNSGGSPPRYIGLIAIDPGTADAAILFGDGLLGASSPYVLNANDYVSASFWYWAAS